MTVKHIIFLSHILNPFIMDTMQQKLYVERTDSARCLSNTMKTLQLIYYGKFNVIRMQLIKASVAVGDLQPRGYKLFTFYRLDDLKGYILYLKCTSVVTYIFRCYLNLTIFQLLMLKQVLTSLRLNNIHFISLFH